MDEISVWYCNPRIVQHRTAQVMQISQLKPDLIQLPPMLLRNIAPLRARVLKRSRALINCDNRLMVIWSAKSACTAVYVWFAQVSGFGDDVRATHERPHIHRTTVYQKSDLYARSLTAPLERYRTLRVIRDPYSRAVSSYRHALMNAYAQPYMTKFSNGTLRRKTGYSFQEFLDMLQSVDLQRENLHFRTQFNVIERISKSRFRH